MPAIYAHERFGSMVSEFVNKDLKKVMEEHPSEFHIGMQGPDIFFFYRAWGENRVRRYGEHLHQISAMTFFEHARKVVKHFGRNSAEYAYLLGFICHFALDSECHGYVEDMVRKLSVNHIEIEEEFEKYLLRKDGINAIAFPAGDLVPTDEETSEAIAPFYSKDVNAELVEDCLNWMNLIKKIFTAPQKWRQELTNRILKATGTYEELKGQMYQMEDNLVCQESNLGLEALFEQAIPVAVKLIENFDFSVCQGTTLSERFNRNFE